MFVDSKNTGGTALVECIEKNQELVVSEGSFKADLLHSAAI